MENYFQDIDKRELLYQSNKIAVMLQEQRYFNNENIRFFINNQLNEKSKEENFRIILLDNTGVVIYDSNETEIGKVILIPEVMEALQGKNVVNYVKDEAAIYASAYIGNFNTNNDGAVLLVSSFENSQVLIEDISQKWVVLTVFISIIIAIFILLTSDIFIKPIKRILASIQEITDGQLHQRVNISGKNEISELVRAFNTMTEKLEKVDEARQEFVSNVSHELKTPLSSIKVLSDSILLEEGIPTEMYREFLKDINSEIDRMTDIVNNLLSLVKLDYKEAGLFIEETNLNYMLEDIIKMVTPLAEQKNIELTSEFLKNVLIEADEMKLSLAISNLVENAIKYTYEGGSVKIILDCDHQNAFITVQDTGIGISEEEQGKIFNRFYRVDKTRDRETGGTGLGLSITHSAVLLHKGSIKVFSKENQGSTFIVRIPIKNTEKSSN